jgi:hypothetical protein
MEKPRATRKYSRHTQAQSAIIRRTTSQTTARSHTSMSDSQREPTEHASTYIVQDRSNQDEMTHLEVQDKMVTTGMGGVLPELPDPTGLQQALKEIQLPDFVATWTLLTAWGTRPDGPLPLMRGLK